jgi:hypothetical protein
MYRFDYGIESIIIRMLAARESLQSLSSVSLNKAYVTEYQLEFRIDSIICNQFNGFILFTLSKLILEKKATKTIVRSDGRSFFFRITCSFLFYRHQTQTRVIKLLVVLKQMKKKQLLQSINLVRF